MYWSRYLHHYWQQYEALLHNYVLPTLQLHQCVDYIIFMQDGAPQHIATPEKQLLSAAAV